jgi:hypothetical protein
VVPAEWGFSAAFFKPIQPRFSVYDMKGGEKLPLKPKTIQIEKVPKTSDAETWANLNERLNDLANQGYRIIHAKDTYILLRREPAAIRREE